MNFLDCIMFFPPHTEPVLTKITFNGETERGSKLEYVDNFASSSQMAAFSTSPFSLFLLGKQKIFSY